MRHIRFVTLIAALAVVLVACGGGEAADDTAAETTAAPDTTGAAETTTAPEAAETTAAESVETTSAESGGACGVDHPALVNPGTLTIATGEPVFPPWMIDDDPTNGEGFESAVAYAVAEEMGFAEDQVEWVRTDFNAAIAPGEKNFDFNIQQYSITEERDEVVDFSEPYYVTNQALVGYEDSAVVGVTSIEDLKGLRLGAQIGTTSFDYIESVIQPDTPAAAYDTNVDAKSALDADQIDGLVFDLPTAYFVTAVEIEGSVIAGVFEVSEELADEFGLLMGEGSELKPCVDEAIVALRDNGTLDDLAEEWLVTGSDIPIIES